MIEKEKAIYKAKKLVDKFSPFAHTNIFSFVKESNLSSSKKCAIICVEDIIAAINMCGIVSGDVLDYFQEVKSEINKL